MPFCDGAEMGIGETGDGFGADFAAADGGIELAVKGDDHFFQTE